jgi:zinc protease
MKRILLLYALLLTVLSMPAEAQERFRRIPPSPDPIQRLDLPKVESYLLANELAVTVVQTKGIPFLSIQLVISAGEKSAPEDLPGLASFTANMVRRGTEELSALDIDDRIEAMGGTLESTIYPDFTIFTLYFLEEYLDEALDILRRMMTASTFPQREITNIKTSLYYSMVQRNAEPEYLARRLLFKKLFANHSYKNITYGENAFTKMDRPKTMDFYSRFYRANNARLILIGNLNLETAIRKVSHHFNRWTKSNLQKVREQPPEPNKKLKICFISRPGSEESVILMGNILSPFSRSEYFPIAVFNHVFGETPNSRLFLNLRESKGFAYNANSRIEIFGNFGVFQIQAWIRPEVTAQAIREIFAELDRTQKQRIPIPEIESAKSYLIGNFPIKIESIQGFSTRIADLVNLNLGKDHWNGYYDAIMRISPMSVSNVIMDKELLSPIIVVVGDRDLVLDDLVRELNEVEIYDIKGNFIQSITK